MNGSGAGAGFPSLGSVAAMIVLGDRPPSHVCKTCGHVFKYLRNLHNHLKYECGKQPSFQCTFCPYKAKLKGNLKKHMTVRHIMNSEAIELL